MKEMIGFWAAVLVLVAVVACANGGDGHDPCDVDGNGKWNDLDYVAFQNAFGSQPGDPNWNKRADMDGDGFISVNDFSAYQAKCGGK